MVQLQMRSLDAVRIFLRVLWNLFVHLPNMKALFQEALRPSSSSSPLHPRARMLCSLQLCLPG